MCSSGLIVRIACTSLSVFWAQSRDAKPERNKSENGSIREGSNQNRIHSKDTSLRVQSRHNRFDPGIIPSTLEVVAETSSVFFYKILTQNFFYFKLYSCLKNPKIRNTFFILFHHFLYWLNVTTLLLRNYLSSALNSFP